METKSALARAEAQKWAEQVQVLEGQVAALKAMLKRQRSVQVDVDELERALVKVAREFFPEAGDYGWSEAAADTASFMIRILTK
jgi:hypothetical protein